MKWVQVGSSLWGNQHRWILERADNDCDQQTPPPTVSMKEGKVLGTSVTGDSTFLPRVLRGACGETQVSRCTQKLSFALVDCLPRSDRQSRSVKLRLFSQKEAFGNAFGGHCRSDLSPLLDMDISCDHDHACAYRYSVWMSNSA